MSALDYNLEDVTEQGWIDDGLEKEITCTSCEQKTSKNDNKMVVTYFRVEGEDVRNIRHQIMLPAGTDDQMDKDNLRSLKELAGILGINMVTPLATLAEGVGQTVFAIIGKRANDGAIGGQENYVKRFVSQKDTSTVDPF